MTGRVFLDTNILVYAIDCSPTNVPKRDRARGLIYEHLDAETGVISIQVLQEFYVASTKRIKVPLSPDEALEFIHYVSVLDTLAPSLEIVTAAIGLHQKHGFSFWDAMIIQSAVVANCNILYSEDLQHGFRLASLSIQNPFLK